MSVFFRSVFFRSAILGLTLTLGACGDTDTGDTGDTGGSEPTSEVTEVGDCHPEDVLAAAPEVAFTRAELDGDFFEVHGLAPTVIESADQLAAFEAQTGNTVTSAVDFETQVVLVSVVELGSTCGGRDPVVHVVEIDGAPHLSLEVTNPDALCREVCDMYEAASQVLIVDRPDTGSATVCGRLIETCG